MGDPVHVDLAARLADSGGVVMMIGGPDTGKTTFSRMLVGSALELGRTVAYIDSDLARTTVRRAERETVRLRDTDHPVNPETLRWLNRASSVLFDLARYEESVAVGGSRPAAADHDEA